MSSCASDRIARGAGPRARAPRLALAALLACGAVLAAPAPAGATFHLNMIREVYPGDLAEPAAEYVELQAYAAGQNFVAGHSVTFYGAGGAKTGTATFGADVPNGLSQNTILIGTTAAAAQFGVTPDLTIAAADLLAPGGGAVCWETIDCVSWGSFSGSLPSPAGTPAPAIPDGMALRRTIARGCATALDEPDDTNSSGADFAAVSPDPRPNSAAPSERACSSQPPGGGSPGGSAAGAPQTRITRHPPHRTRDRTPVFGFASSVAGSTFLCKLDRAPFRRCRSPFRAHRLSLGRHLFEVEARASGGPLDPTPARYRFKVVKG